MVRVEAAEVGLDEALRQGLETPRRAVPGELVAGVGQRAAEIALEAAAHQRVEAVGGDDEVVAVELIQRLHLGAVTRLDADGVRARLQQVQQCKPADRGEANAVDLDPLATQVQRDVGPALHVRRDRVHRLRIIGAQEFQRLVREHHAKAPGDAGGVLLEQVDLRLGVAPLPEIGEVESSRTSAEYGDAHAILPRV